MLQELKLQKKITTETYIYTVPRTALGGEIHRKEIIDFKIIFQDGKLNSVKLGDLAESLSTKEEWRLNYLVSLQIEQIEKETEALTVTE